MELRGSVLLVMSSPARVLELKPEGWNRPGNKADLSILRFFDNEEIVIGTNSDMC